MIYLFSSEQTLHCGKLERLFKYYFSVQIILVESQQKAYLVKIYCSSTLIQRDWRKLAKAFG